MFRKTRFEKIYEPGQIGRLKTKNRMVKCAQSMHFSTEDGYVSDTNLAYYETIAKSGVGLICVEMAAIDYPIGYPSLKNLRIDDDKFIPRLGELTKLIHSYGVPTLLQLSHAGPSHAPILNTEPRSSSSLRTDELPARTYRPTIGLTIPEIEDLVDKFAKGAERAQKAGFDGVEVHGAHHYLINSFLSGIWNKRRDCYGGSLENRARFACEIIRAIRERVGQDFAICIRVNGAEYGAEGGLTPEESQAQAKMIQDSGADAIHVSVFGFGTYNSIQQPEQIFYPEAPKPLGKGLDASKKGGGGLTLLAAGIKKVVSIPVITVGRLDPMLGETVLRQDRADFVAFGRCLMADPEIILKVMEGRTEDIRQCTACLVCLDNYRAGGPVVCRVNPALGREWEYVVRPAERGKKVIVVGSGPAGMEAASVAALRGHQVTLYERAHKLGGLMLIHGVVKGLEVEDIVALIRYFKTQISKGGVNVRIGKEVNGALIEKIKPDVVILAMGGIATVLEIPGSNRHIVTSQSHFHRMAKTYMRFFGPKVMRWLTNFYLPIGKRVIIIGGGIQGMELAEFLVKRGRKVTVTETSSELGAELVVSTKERLLPWLAKKGCTLLTGVKYEEITDKGLSLVTKEGERLTIEADTIVPAIPLRPNTELFEALQGKVPEIYLIGDCREPHLILEAIHEGFRTASTI